jgi:hypothetical protein
MILVSKYFVPKGYEGITLYPFVFLKDKKLKEDVILLNHELIHITQQKELLVLFFYLWYVIEFFIRLLVCKNWSIAYESISFEQEAYDNQSNLMYIQKRPRWAFLKYLKKINIINLL